MNWDANAGHYASDVQYNRDASDEEIHLQLKGMAGRGAKPDQLGASS
jgi:hypothetical protein